MPPEANPSESDPQAAGLSDLEREIRAGREWTIADIIAQEGGSFLKGESPIPRPLQAEAEIRLFLDRHLSDTSGVLKSTLQTWVKTESPLSQHLDTPLQALYELLNAIVKQPSLLYEFVRQVDMRWGQLYDERPYFQQPGQPAHPHDEYTHESVHSTLSELLAILNAQL